MKPIELLRCILICAADTDVADLLSFHAEPQNCSNEVKEAKRICKLNTKITLNEHTYPFQAAFS